MQIADSTSNKRYFWLIVFLFAVLYSAISLINHYFFRTYALDLGAYTNALYDYSHFSFNDSTAFRAYKENLLADHFDLFLPFISPLSWIFGSYTLLVVQLIALLIGGAGVYRYFHQQQFPLLQARWAMVYFFCFFGVFGALSYDYHSNVIAACVLPWLFLFLNEKKWWQAVLCFALILICKENMSLWMIFVCLGWAYIHRKDKSIRNISLILCVIAIFYFLLVTAFIMPAVSVHQKFGQFRYSALGHSYGEAFATMFTQPVNVIKILFTNHNQSPSGDGIKAEFWIFFFLSGGVFLLLRPVWIFMLVPVFMQKLLHDQVQMWGINNQYCIELAPVMAIGVFTQWQKIKTNQWKNIYTGIVMVLVMITSFRMMDAPHAFVRKENIRFYQSIHYSSDKNIFALYKTIALIPHNASVSAISFIHPHLAWRDKCYQFPLINDAEYIIYQKQEYTYPLKKEEFFRITDSLEKSTAWKPVYQSNGIVLLQRKKP